MEKIMNVTGIRCDAPNCGFEDPTVQSAELEKYIDTPCPLCDENLLTRKDYDKFKLMEKICNSWFVRMLNKLMGKLGFKSRTYTIKLSGPKDRVGDE